MEFFDDIEKAHDPSKGGKLVKKTIVDKTGKRTTKWVSKEQASKMQGGQNTDPEEAPVDTTKITDLPSNHKAALEVIKESMDNGDLDHALELANKLPDEVKEYIPKEDWKKLLTKREEESEQDAENKSEPKSETKKETKPKKKKDTKDGIEYADEEIVGAIGDQSNAKMDAKIDGKVVGTVSYSIYEGQPSIQMIEVGKDQKRKSIATNLMKNLQKKYPDVEIDLGGFMTEEGSNFISKLDREFVPNTAYSDTEELISQLQQQSDKIIEEISNNNYTNADTLDDISDTIYDLKVELEEAEKGKYIINTKDKKVLTDKEIFAEYDQEVSKYSEDQVYSLNEYRGADYRDINADLRDDNELNEDNQRIVDDIDSAFIPSKQDMVLTRGIAGKSDEKIKFFLDLEVGDEYTDKGYSSTSVSADAVDGFLDNMSPQFSKSKMVLTIVAKKGSKIVPMQNVGSEHSNEEYKKEKEILLPRNSKFKVLSKTNGAMKVQLL